jgi:hypothetical protein
MTDAIAHEAFRDALNALKPGWEVTERGIVGPKGAVVRLLQQHPSQSEGHVDVQFVLNDGAPVRLTLWDCVAGVGRTPADRAQFAAHLWSQTTAGALLELKYSLRGEFADHFSGDDPAGFQGWHSICGAILGYGHGDSPDQLQQWWLDHPILPVIARALDDSLNEHAGPHGIKILFGGDGVAEVRLNGEAHGPASEALANLDWPRLDPPGFVRSYVIAVHRETAPT